jgi:hypothetical protein
LKGLAAQADVAEGTLGVGEMAYLLGSGSPKEVMASTGRRQAQGLSAVPGTFVHAGVARRQNPGMSGATSTG